MGDRMKQLQQKEQQTELLIQLVTLATQTDRGALLMRKRGQATVAHARQIAMYLSHTSFGLSLNQVGDLFGRDKSTVGHAVKQVEDLRDSDEFENWISELETTLDAGCRLLETDYPLQAASKERRCQMAC